MPNSSGDIVSWAAGLNARLTDCSLLISDLWGVIHDGMQLNSASVTAIENARREGVTTLFLSNAPRPRTFVRDQLIAMGLPIGLADNVVTSGGLARDEVRQHYRGARLYHMGPSHDRNTIEGLPIEEVLSPDDADIILATDLDFPSVEAHRRFLQVALERETPFLCANPDRVVHVGSRLYSCAGAVADLYTDMGGTVAWFGKPQKEAMLACLTEVNMEPTLAGGNVLMVGDSLQTDMAGARAAGFQSLLVAGGIHRDSLPQLHEVVRGRGFLEVSEFKTLFGEEKPIPHALLEKLVW